MRSQLDYILFVYGLTFIVIFQAILALRQTRETTLPWVLLGGFGIAYGLNVWLELFANAFGDPIWFQAVRLALVAGAFLSLLEFARAGCERLGLSVPRRWILGVFVLVAALGGIVGLSGLSATIRYVLGLGGCTWAAYTVWRYRSARYPREASLAALVLSFALFGVFAGLVVCPGPLAPARILNTSEFLAWAGFPVQLLRAIAALLMSAALWRHYRFLIRREHPDRAQTPLSTFGWVILSVMLAVVAAGWVGTQRVGESADRQLRDQLLDRTDLAAAAVNPSGLVGLELGPSDLNKPEYLLLREQLIRIASSTADIRWSYLMESRGGEILFIADSAPEGDPGHAQPGEPYLKPPAGLADVLSGQSQGTTVGLYTDEYGTFVSGFAPVRDPETGRTVAAMGLDIDGATWEERIASRRLIPITVTLFLVVVLLGVSAAWDRLRRTSIELADSEAKFRAMTDTASDAIVLIDADGEVTFWNGAAERMFGYSAAEATGRNLHDLVAPSRYHSEHRRGFAEFRVSGSGPALGRTLEMHALRRDGSEFPVDLTVSAVPLGNRMHAVGIMRDATARNQMLEELRQTRDALTALIQAAPVGIVSLDLEEGVMLWNPAAERLTGWSAEEVTGKPIPWVPDEAREESERLRTAWLAGELIEGIEVTRRRRDGTPLEISFYSAPLRDGQGKMIGDMGVFMDIADRKRAEEALAKARNQLEITNRQLELTVQRANQLALEAQIANQAKSEFLANMSHEIRTPMNGVIGMTGLLLDTDLTYDQRDYAETIAKSADSLLTMINDILDFSKIEAGKLELEELDFDLRTTLETVADLLALKAHEKDLELAILVDPDVPSFLRGDPGRLRQVLTNLIGNAVKFTEEGEIVVTVSTAREEPHAALLRFEVRDSGVGIPPDQVERLFQPFTQADASTTRRYGGTGLGLSISKQLAEKMGGSIGVTSTPGEGSTFWFTARFEVGWAAERPMDDLGQMPLDVSGVRMLAVDDNATNRKVIAGMLQSWGCRHDEVDGADACLAALDEADRVGDPYRAVILDMVMPGCDGEMLGKRIKADRRFAALPLIMMTSMGSRGDAVRLENAGFSAYLTKPVKQSCLFDCLATVINSVSDLPREMAPRPRLVTKHTLAEDRRRRLRILVAEDNAINQKVVLKTLERMGFRADAVANGREALRALETLPYDLVLMDIQMPEMDGMEATARIRDPRSRVRDHLIPIVALTAHAMAGDRQQALEAGMDAYLTKPIKPEELGSVIARLLADGEPPESIHPPNERGQEPGGEQGPDAVGEPVRTPPPADRTVYDRTVLLGMLGGDEAVAGQIIAEFLRDAQGQLEEIHAVGAAADFELLKRAAHRLKGSAANVGAMDLRNEAVRLEAAASAGNAEAAASLTAAVATAMQAFRAAVEGAT